MRTSEQINEVFAALAQAQGELKPAIKDAENPAYRSRYADLAAVWEAIHAVLPKHKLSVVQELTNESAAHVAVNTRIGHASGQWIECGPFTVPTSKQDAHGVGSASSYAKRYALSAAIGVVAEDDDDANAATGNGQPAKRERVKAGRQPGESPAEYAERKPAPADVPDATTVRLSFGSAKGMTVRETPTKDLQWYRRALSENVADESKAKWKADNQRTLDCVVAELEHREQTDEAPFGPSGDEPPLAKGVSPLATAGRSVETVQAPALTAPKEEDRTFYTKSINRKANELNLTTEERLALRRDFLNDKPNDTADIKLVHALYLKMGDPQTMKDWREQLRARAQQEVVPF